MGIYAFTMLLAGVGIPLMAALNAALGRHMASPAAAAAVLFASAMVIGLVAVAITGPGALIRVATAPRHLLLGGALVAFYVLSVTYIAPHFGVGNAVFCVLIGQLISAAAIDHFGLFGAPVTPVSAMRGLGLALMGAGTWVTLRG
ncbi:DMT family transporter [Arenibacterium halophilum]|jgi:transporter family-2 protein|uniref:DMT family transporter n=1 Tax=Arenibacterium halophilum TaxID=2583821 RepID=A0ABY2XE13_9RHOB|nr:DMT family transporter [Arenibacterium halophilum]MAY86975.1 hypothetical protein [Pseudooceanicola sp.]TMV14861.1 DMT family transporter [Arenibacterium halophilum]